MVEPPTTTSPVLTPIRMRSETPQAGSNSPFSVSRASPISAAARTARRASSSCSTGVPKNATTASPMYFSTVPPCRSITARISSKKRVMTRRTDSGSSRSPRGVEPTTSQNRTVTVLRASPATGAGVGSGAAQDMQNRARAGFDSPQDVHTGMRRV